MPTSLNLTRDLGPLRAKAVANVEQQAESVRGRFVTLGSGQAMTYDEKYQEAVAFLADPDIDPSEVGHIYREVGTTGQTAYEVAQVVVNMRGLWKLISPIIEGARLEAKAAIAEANSPAAILVAATIDWDALLPSMN